MKVEKSIMLFISSLTLLTAINLMFHYFHLFSGGIWNLLIIIDLMVLFYSLSYLLNDFYFESGYFKVVFRTFCVYQLVIIARGFALDYAEIKNYLVSDYVFWPFVIPLTIFFNKEIETLGYLLKGMYYLSVFFLIIAIVYPILIFYRPTAESFIHPFAFGGGFLLMNAYYLSKKKTVVSAFVTILAIIAFVYLARRNAVVTFSGFLFTAILLYFRNVSSGKLAKAVPIIGLIIILPFFVLDKIPLSFTKNLSERITEDTRSVVFDAFDAGMLDYEVFGKGLNGSYYLPFAETSFDDGTSFSETTYRNVIENGYLQLMLTGGYVHMGLFVLLLAPAAYLGIFKSSNSFSRSCGLLILLWLLDMAIYGMPRLVLEYVFVWISVGICYKASFRKKTDEDFHETFKNIGL